MTDDSRFCESCGADQELAVWSIEVAVDATRLEDARRVGLDFPHERPPATIPLESTRVVIGRGRGRDDDVPPDLDLSGALADPGVSHVHLVIAREDGQSTVTDLGSTNGTTVNDVRLDSHVPHPITAGDEIAIGIWTKLRIGLTIPDNPG